jgi:hypothetical protein
MHATIHHPIPPPPATTHPAAPLESKHQTQPYFTKVAQPVAVREVTECETMR